jgi:hypothetical protein
MGVRNVGRAALALAFLLGASSAIARPQEFGSGPASSDTLPALAAWVIASADNQGLPFAIIDKAAAQVFIYDAEGRLKGEAPALLGLATGDHSTPGIGDRELSAIRPAERTTPAGRFVAAYGAAPGKRKVLWVDYATAISLHPVVTTNRKERRLERLRTPSPADNRITYGCINVPATFYRDTVVTTFKARGVVYILPETMPLQAVFPSFEIWAQADAERRLAATSDDAAPAGPP